jgi:hypothetical protein
MNLAEKYLQTHPKISYPNNLYIIQGNKKEFPQNSISVTGAILFDEDNHKLCIFDGAMWCEIRSGG